MAIKEGYRISSARGLARFNGALAHVLSSALIVGAAYSALCLLLFAIAIMRGGQNYTHGMLAAFLPAMIINAVLVISVALETMTIYRITGSAVLSGAVIIIGFVMSLTLYGNLPSGTYTILAMDLPPSGAVPWSRMCPWV